MAPYRDAESRNRWLPLLWAFMVGVILTAPTPLRELAFRFEWIVYDRVMSLLPAAEPSGRVLPVLITEAGIDLFGQWPWDREVFVALLRVCREYRAAAVVFDILFTEAQQPALADAADAADPTDDTLAFLSHLVGGVYYASVVDLKPRGPRPPAHPPTSERIESMARRFALPVAAAGFPHLPQGEDWFLPLPELAHAAAGEGFINVPTDADGVVRRTQLLVGYGDRVFPSLDLLVTMDLLGASPERTTGDAGRGLLLRDGTGAALRRIPVTPAGELFVNFAPTGDYLRPDRAVDLVDVLRSAVQAVEGATPVLDLGTRLRDKIVLVGTSLEGSTDVRPTPGDPLLPLVLVHANVLDNILQGPFRRPLATPGSWPLNVFVFGTVLLLGVVLPRISYLAGAVLVVLLGVLAAAAVAACALWTEVVPPLLVPGAAALAVYTGITSYSVFVEDRERRRTRAIWSRYSSPEVVEEVLSDPAKAGLFGTRRKVTVISIDVRGFTHHAESTPPEAVVEMLNRYFAVMAEVVLRHNGTINNYIGDCMMVLFGAPVAREDDTARAVRTAWEIGQAIRQLVQADPDMPACGVGIGVNTGEAVVGNIGTERFMAYTAIGDAVNTAFRIEALAVSGQVILSQSTYEEVRAWVEVRPLPPATVKGKSEPVVIYELVGLREEGGQPERASLQ